MKNLNNVWILGACLFLAAGNGCSSSSANTATGPARGIASATDQQIDAASVCIVQVNIQTTPATASACAVSSCTMNPDGSQNCPPPNCPPSAPQETTYTPRFTCDGSAWQTLGVIAASPSYDTAAVELTGQLKNFTSKGFKIASCSSSQCVLGKY